MTLDPERWRDRGHHVRAVESLRSAPHAVTREQVAATLQVTFARALAELPEEERATALALAIEGYIAEHLARGGLLAA